MGLISKEVEIGLTGFNNINRYKELGYNIPTRKDKWGRWTVPKGTKILVHVKDLPHKSNVYVEVKCDCCKEIKNITWQNYMNSIYKYSGYYCHNCINKLFGSIKTIQTKLKNGISFYMWCLDNKRFDLIERWDYKLNNCDPNEVLFGSSSKKYYFKCPFGIHNSEKKDISLLTCGNIEITCKACNSFAQWGINNLDKNFLEKYWDNNKNILVDPWKLDCGSEKSFFIKCQEKKYHESYKTNAYNFIKGNRCPYCSNRNNKVHPLDSLGKILEDLKLLDLWSDINKKIPYEYRPYSNVKIFWKCHNQNHNDYIRKISESTRFQFKCPQCNNSKGEEKIQKFLDINNILYIRQKVFDDLLGIGNGLLSYDFYLDRQNLLIEFQGEFHDGSGGDYTKINLKRQKEHDRRKREYAKDHNIELLEIWYWDFDNIETILKEKLNLGD